MDDGYSGVNFDRPDFKRIMEEVKNRLINCIIVKDLSRFGWNYIEAGKYLEQVFPFLGVRFIAITDDIDTGWKQSDANQFILPFKNLFKDSYKLSHTIINPGNIICCRNKQKNTHPIIAGILSADHCNNENLK